MKHLKRLLITTSLATALMLTFSISAFAAETSQITTTGTGIVNVQPDTAKISLSTETNGKTAALAQSENNKITSNITKKLKEAGIPQDNIITTYSYVYPNYQYDEKTGKNNLINYQATSILEVTTKDVDHAGNYIDVALNAGATGFHNIYFTLENPNAYYAEALKAAVANAQNSAGIIANAYGRPLGTIQTVVEQPSYNSYRETSATMEKMQSSDEMMGQNSGTLIQYDDIQVSATITATYNY